MATRKYAVLLEAAEEGGFIVKSTELPVASQGETREEALKNIKEAIEGYLEVKAQLLKKKVKVEKAEVVVEAPLCSLGRRLLRPLPKMAFESSDKKAAI